MTRTYTGSTRQATTGPVPGHSLPVRVLIAAGAVLAALVGIPVH